MPEAQTRIVLVGCGGISGAWLKPCQARGDVAIVGLVDLNAEAAHKLADEFGLREAVVGTRLAEVLAATRPAAVFDCTVPEAHAEVTLTALAHGCHVLGEKPMADSVENARRMVAAAAQAGRVYAVIQNRRYDPNIRRLREFIASDAIGAITTVHSDFFIGAHFDGFRLRMEHVLLADMAIHTFDAARFISGEDAVSVLCHEWNPAGSWYDFDASAAAIFEMTNGVVYTYRASWCAEGCNTAWEASWRIIGEKGSLTWDGGKEFQCQAAVGGLGFRRQLRDVTVPAATEAGLSGHAAQIDEFLRCLRDGGVPETICTDNVKSLVMVHAAIAGSEKGRRVRIEELGV